MHDQFRRVGQPFQVAEVLHLLEGLGFRHALVHRLLGLALKLLLKVHLDVDGESLVGDRHAHLLQLGDEHALLRLVAQVQRGEVNLGDEQLGHPHDALLASLGVFLHNLAVQRDAQATLEFVIVMLLGLGNNLHPLADVPDHLLLEAHHQLLADLAVQRARGVGTTGPGATHDERGADAPRLHQLGVDAVVVVGEVRHALAPEDALHLDAEVVDEQLEVGGERVLHIVAQVVQLALAGNPRLVVAHVVDAHGRQDHRRVEA